MQRRWIPALIFGTSFIACFVVFLVCAIKIILSVYAIGFEFNTYEETEAPKFMALISFLVALLIYVVSFVDTYRAYGRECTSWARRKLRLP